MIKIATLACPIPLPFATLWYHWVISESFSLVSSLQPPDRRSCFSFAVQVPLFIHASSTDRAVRRVSWEAILGIRGSLASLTDWQSNSVATSSTFLLPVTGISSSSVMLNELSWVYRKRIIYQIRKISRMRKISLSSNISLQTVADFSESISPTKCYYTTRRRNFALEFRKTRYRVHGALPSFPRRERVLKILAICT